MGLGDVGHLGASPLSFPAKAQKPSEDAAWPDFEMQFMVAMMTTDDDKDE